MPKAVSLGVRLGVSLGKQLGVSLNDPASKLLKLYALTNFTAANYLATQAGGGEAGLASGFGIVELFRLDALTAATQYLFTRLGANLGYLAALESGTTGRAYFRTGSGQVGGPIRSFVASDVGKIFLLIERLNGANQSELYADRVSRGVVAQSAYGPASAAEPTTLGAINGGSGPATGVSILSTLTFRGAPTDAQLFALFDAARTLGDLPKTIDGATVTHRWSAKDQLAKAGAPVVDGQAAPAQLDDTVTGATVDALVKVGSPLVRVIDPAIDGRTTKGVLGFSGAAFLESASAIPGSEAGFRITVHVRLEATPTGNQTVVQRTIGPGGWYLTSFASQLWFTLSNGSTLSAGPVFNITNADVGRTMAITVMYNGSSLFMVIDGVSFTPVAKAATPAIVPCPLPMQVGQNRGIQPASSWSVLGIEHGAVATIAEIQAQHAAIASTGRIQPMATGSVNRWDFTADFAANNGELPAVFADRIGSDHLARLGPDITIAGKRGLKLLASGTTIINGFGTAPGGGITGSASALTIELLWSPTVNLVAANELIATMFSSTGPRGFYFQRTGTAGQPGTIAFGIIAAGGNTITGTYAIQPADIGTILHVAATYDGANVRWYVNGNLISTVAFTQPYVSPPGASMLLGARIDGGPSNNDNAFFGIGGGAYVATQAELAAQATASIAAGKLIAIPGKADQRRYNFDPNASAQNPLPTQLPDEMGNADPLVRYGAGLQVAQRVERLFSYETTPIISGVKSLAANDNYSAPTAVLGDPSGFMVELLFQVLAAGTSATRMLCAKKGPMGGADPNAFRGWQIYTTGANGAIQGSLGSTTNVSAPIAAVPAGDIGKLLAYTLVWDLPSGKVRGYFKRVEAGTGTSLSAGYLANNVDPFTLGKRSDGSPADNIAIHGFRAGNFVPTLAEVQSAHDAIMAEERTPLVYPGRMLTHAYRFPNGVVPATLINLINPGTDDCALNGAPQSAQQYARAWGW